jgi:hypothetical protein
MPHRLCLIVVVGETIVAALFVDEVPEAWNRAGAILIGMCELVAVLRRVQRPIQRPFSRALAAVIVRGPWQCDHLQSSY